MNPTQLAARSSLLAVPQRPRIVDWSLSRTETINTSFTINLPHRREAGVLMVMILSHSSGTLITRPSGWTNLASTSSNKSTDICYKFSDGSEGPTGTASCAVSVTWNAVTLSILGSSAARPPTANCTEATFATSINPANLSATAPYGSPLWLAYLTMAAVQEPTQSPIGFSTGKRFFVQGSNSGAHNTTLVLAENKMVTDVDLSAWNFASASASGGVICVRGA